VFSYGILLAPIKSNYQNKNMTNYEEIKTFLGQQIDNLPDFALYK
jgi:hypothetical protein